MPDIQIPSLDGASFQAYAALPSGGQGPAVLVIQEIFGVNDSMRRNHISVICLTKQLSFYIILYYEVL